jgi:hypothetical protein
MKSDRERDGLLGPVHTVECVRDPKRAVWTTCPSLEITYDRDGWRKEQVWADADGSASGRSVYRRNPATGNVEVENLDKAGKPTGIRSVISCDEVSRTFTEETFAAWGSAGRRVMRFDAHGNVSVEESFYSDGSLNNRLVEKYDKHGRHSETVFDDPHSVAAGKTTLRYDARGTLLEQDWYNKAGNLYSKDFFTDKLDSHGNWVERSSQPCEPSPEKPSELVCGALLTQRRRISYYEDGQ